MEYRSLAGILCILLALTAATVSASRLELGENLHFLHIWISIGIASIKACFVLWYFMHLKHEPAFIRWFFVIAILILAIFIGFTIIDVAYS